MRVFFWGIGKRCEKTLDSFIGDDSEILGFIDNNPEYKGNMYQGKPIYTFSDVMAQDFDYIVITILNYNAIVYQITQNGVGQDKVICYFRQEDCNKNYDAIFDRQKWKINLLEERVEQLEYLLNIRFNNLGYEVADKIAKDKYWFPAILDGKDAIERIVGEGCSLVRFGDGEFEIMRGNERAPFQTMNTELSQRLAEVLSVDDDKILIGIADNYGNLDKYTEQTAQGIRQYMTDEVRAFHLSVLNPDRIYYNAYLFKTYMPYKDKGKTAERVALVRKVWDDRDVVFIEGAYTRTGYGNDLFDNAKSVKRILCPTKNAYDKYDEILSCAKKLDKNCLILIVLGPAGKVLAYDLVREGYQVVDIGQIDMDYEWYLAGIGERVPIPHKYVSQLPPAEVCDLQDAEYHRQIIAKVGV